jgi:hypothetical protein
MGKGKDMVSGTKRMNDSFGYDPYGVRTMFESYYELKEMGLSNWQAVDIILDFEKALSATIMTAESRVMVGLVYGFGLTIMQASKLAGIKMSEAKEALDEALEVVEACLNGYDTTFFHKTTDSTAINLDEWLAGVRSGQTLALDIPPAVMDNMFNYLISIGDKKILAIINPKPQEEEEEEEPFGGYPFHPTSASIEDPNRKGSFNRYKDKDYFVIQDKRNNVVSLDSIKDPDALISLKTTGKRKSKGDGEDEETNVLKNGRSNIYEQY